MSQDATNLQLVKFLNLITTKITPKLVQYNSNKCLIAMAIATLLPTSNPTLLQHVPALLEVLKKKMIDVLDLCSDDTKYLYQKKEKSSKKIFKEKSYDKK